MNILITGVAGLLGSRLADWIIENKPEANVIGVDDLSGGYIENVNDQVTFYNMKVESDEIKELFSKHDIDYVYHFAAYAAEGLSPFIRTFNYTNNLLSTANIVNQCINNDIKRLVFTSSMAVYGENTPPFSEDMPRNPIDPYGVAKAACERDIEIAGEQHGLDWCIIRPHNVYGKKQNIWDKYRNVLGIWMYQHMNENPITIFGDGTQTRAFSYIDDVLEPFWNAATDERASKEIINLGGIKEYTITEAADILMEVMGGEEVKYLEQRHEVKHAWSTHQKSVELLDYTETVGLKEGLIEMWEWAQEQPTRKQQKFTTYEVDKGIYSFWK
ncbi:MAG: NAD-dependent epimerase/dehydratase family protein [Proteobacteria bacterium]|nr:NAD-dependent epimerase/dehydratase family protein [Pseudomonadota bacterium]